MVGMGPAADLVPDPVPVLSGYIALWAAIEDPDTAADLTSVLCLVGSVFAVLSRYAANFWNQGLHQGASLSVAPGTRMDWAYKAPLYLAMAGFVLLFVALVLAGTRTEIRARRTETYVVAGDGTIILRFAGPITQQVVETRIRPAMERAAAR
jgi:hypothetical protein